MKTITVDGIKYVAESELLKEKKQSKVECDIVREYRPALKVFEIGAEVFIKTVTYNYTGRIVDVNGGFVFLEDVAWIADSGRFTEFMKEEKEPQSMESELYGDRIVRINIGSIVEVVERKLVVVQK